MWVNAHFLTGGLSFSRRVASHVACMGLEWLMYMLYWTVGDLWSIGRRGNIDVCPGIVCIKTRIVRDLWRVGHRDNIGGLIVCIDVGKVRIIRDLRRVGRDNNDGIHNVE